MVLISKTEKDEIEKMFPKAHIVRTMRGDSKRHRYYCEESVPVMKYLAKARNRAIVSSSGGAANGT